jgi:protein-disulfide isomerase
MESVDELLDHVRGPEVVKLIVEYGDYECPYSRAAYRSIQHLETRLDGCLRFTFWHFPLIAIHPHALAASLAAEAASLQGRFWEMHDMLFHRQKALEDEDLRRYGTEIGLDVERFDDERRSEPVVERIERDIRGAIASGEVVGTPTLFIDGIVHSGGHDPETLLEALGS